MTNQLILPLLAVLIVSYTLALWAARKRRSPRVEDYLFHGNRPSFAFSSGIGSLFSLSIACTALLSGGYVFGWQVVFSWIAGAACGLYIILKMLKKESVLRYKATIQRQKNSHGISLILLLGEGRTDSFRNTFLAFLLLSYAAMLTMEIAMLRIFISHLTAHQDLETIWLLCLVVLTCFAYVFIGGFLGVLVTDHFQLLIVIAFISTLIFQIHPSTIINSIPTATTAIIQWNFPRLFLLHFAIFFGALSVTTSSIDQWHRTIATLKISEARKVLTWSTLVSSGLIAIPLLAGSYAHSLQDLPAGIGNEVSLSLLSRVLTSSSDTTKLLLAMTLGCALLTTLDTYIITIQQLYYEFSVHLHARRFLSYIAEYALKWKQIRGVAFFVTIGAIGLSFFVTDDSIYFFGVLALSSVFFVFPLVGLEVLPWGERSRFKKVLDDCSPRSLVAGLMIFPLILYGFHKNIGPVTLHLYLIPAAATISAIAGYVSLIILETIGAKHRERKGRPT